MNEFCSLRRQLTSKNELPEIIGFETMTSFAIQFLLTAFIAGVWSQLPYALEGGLALVAVSYVVTALIFLRSNP